MIFENAHFLEMSIVRPLCRVIFPQKWLQIMNSCRKRPSQVFNWDPEGRPEDSWRHLWGSFWRLLEGLWSSWGPLWVLTGLHEHPWGALGLDFLCFFTFYQAKVQFAKKNINFTCIRAILGVCYAGKSAILKKRHYFYLHTRHLRSSLGACYAGKSDVFF